MIGDNRGIPRRPPLAARVVGRAQERPDESKGCVLSERVGLGVMLTVVWSEGVSAEVRADERGELVGCDGLTVEVLSLLRSRARGHSSPNKPSPRPYCCFSKLEPVDQTD